MNNEIQFSILNLSNKNELIQYEKGLFKAFFETLPDTWIQEHYIKKENNRLVSYIPYDDLIIYQGYLADKLVCANAINITMQQTQIQKLGFSYSPDPKTVEGVHMYIQNIQGENAIQIGDTFFNFVMSDLKKRDYQKLISSCTKKLKALYLLFDFEIIDEIMIGGEKEFLIQCDI